MRLLFQCNTVYQVLIAIHIKYSSYYNVDSDIIISDIMNDYESISRRIKESKLFNNVFIQNVKDNNLNKIESKFGLGIKKKININAEKFFDCFSYSDFLFCNPSIYNLYIIKKYKKLNIQLFEDGLATYSLHYKELYNDKVKGLKSRLGFFNQLKRVKNIFTMSKDSFMWIPNFNITELPSFIDITNEEKQLINCIFDYNDNLLPNDCKYLFFEEGYFGDGKKINDVEIINQLITSLGEESFYVKIHPRNRTNRFSGTNIKTLQTSSIPWEVIILNNIDKINNITIISIASAAIFTPNILFKLKPRVLFMIDLINDKSYLYKYIPDVERLIASNNDNIILVKNMEDL